MSKTTNALLDQIEEAALDPNVALSDALRLCVSLGSRLGSRALRDWAEHELKGYQAEADTPDYRTAPAALYLEITNRFGVNGRSQHISPEMLRKDLPDPILRDIQEQVRFNESIKELEEHAKSHEELRITFGNSQSIAQYLTKKKQEEDPVAYRSTVIAAIYWMVSPAALRGIIDQVRTSLVVLIAELREKVEDSSDLSAGQANDALLKAVPGLHIENSPGTTVTVNQSGSGSITNTVTSGSEPPTNRFWRALAWVLGFVVAAVGAYAGLGQWLSWPAPWK